MTSIAYRIPITLLTDAAHRLIKSSLRWAFLSAKRIKTDSQTPSARQEKRDQNHTVEKQSREDWWTVYGHKPLNFMRIQDYPHI